MLKKLNHKTSFILIQKYSTFDKVNKEIYIILHLQVLKHSKLFVAAKQIFILARKKINEIIMWNFL